MTHIFTKDNIIKKKQRKKEKNEKNNFTPDIQAAILDVLVPDHNIDLSRLQKIQKSKKIYKSG